MVKLFLGSILFSSLLILSGCCKSVVPTTSVTGTSDTVIKYYPVTFSWAGEVITKTINPCDSLVDEVIKKKGITLSVKSDKKGKTEIKCEADSLNLVIDSLKEVITITNDSTKTLTYEVKKLRKTTEDKLTSARKRNFLLYIVLIGLVLFIIVPKIKKFLV